MKENFPNWLQEIDMQVQESQRVPNKMDGQRLTPRHIMIKMPKVKDKENLKSSKRKAKSYLQRSSHKTDFSNLQARRDWQEIFKVMKSKPTAKIALASKDIIQNQGADKELPTQEKI